MELWLILIVMMTIMIILFIALVGWLHGRTMASTAALMVEKPEMADRLAEATEEATETMRFSIFTLFFVIIFICVGGGLLTGMLPIGAAGVVAEKALIVFASAMTMIGCAFAAALCILVAARTGLKSMVEKPELSIWSLLFVALGEGLAIYGLIVAILIVMA